MLQQVIAPAAFETWIKDTLLVYLDDQQAVVATPNVFSRETIEGSFMTQIRHALHTVVGAPIAVEVVIAAHHDEFI